jgi:hypothetical protein
VGGAAVAACHSLSPVARGTAAGVAAPAKSLPKFVAEIRAAPEPRQRFLQQVPQTNFKLMGFLASRGGAGPKTGFSRFAF